MSVARAWPGGGRGAEEGVEESAGGAERGSLLVLGGNGFVGGAVCRAGLRHELSVASASRSGAPPHSEPWVERVRWHAADALVRGELEPLLPRGPGSAVVSCVGAFGSNATMERLCGDATAEAAAAAAAAGTERFVFVSAHDFRFPEAIVRNFGYLNGKRRAEEAVRQHFPDGKGIIVRPGAVYGSRKVYRGTGPGGTEGGHFEVPLHLLFRPLARAGAVTQAWRTARRASPGGLLGVGALEPLGELALTAPVSVRALGDACVAAAKGDLDAELSTGWPVVDEIRLAEFDAACEYGTAPDE
eukprot:PRCOL_00006580-RA